MADENTPPPYRSSPSWFGLVKESAKTRGEVKRLAERIADGKSAKTEVDPAEIDPKPEPAKP